MAETTQARKLASIVAIDVAGYSRRTEADEEAAVKAVAALKASVSRSAEAHGGRVFNTAGDGFMLEFPSASSALEAAEKIARAGDPPVRVGVHLGDVSVTEDGDLLGHGVNVAARIQQMAQPGAVLVSGDVKRAIRGHFSDRLKSQGSVRLDKMSEVIPVFALAPAEGGKARGRRLAIKGPLAVAAATAAAVLIGLGAWFARDFVSRAAHGPVRVAIQPFTVEGNDAALRPVADAMIDKTVEVLTANQVQTTSPASGGDPSRPASVASDAAFALSGAIRRDGEMLRVTAQMEDVRQKVVLWSGEVAAPSAQASAFELQAATRLAGVIKCAASARRGGLAAEDTETLSLIVRDCDADFSLNDLGRIEQVLSMERQIVARAPRLAFAHSNLAYNSVFMSDFFPPGRREELRQAARTEAERALALSAKDGDAFFVLEMLLPPGQKAKRDALLARGVSADPNSEGISFRYGRLLSEVGRLQDSAMYMQKAAALEPLDAGAGAEAALAQARVGQLDRADGDLKQILLAWPDAQGPIGSKFYLARWEGRFDDALAMLQGDSILGRDLSPAERKAWRDVLLALMSRDPRRMTAQRDAQLAFGDTSPINLSFSVENLCQLGLLDDAFAQAAKLQGVEVPINSPVLFNPTTAPMRRDRRFIPLAAKLGLVDYWRSTGKWPDFCSEPGLPYDCKAEAAKLAASARSN
jgi:class 3 adenylate cyclase/TolB-like protein/tetratricopeptide (TPR) repeat protein